MRTVFALQPRDGESGLLYHSCRGTGAWTPNKICCPQGEGVADPGELETGRFNPINII